MYAELNAKFLTKQHFISQVEYIPQAKIASLFVVFGLVIVCKSQFTLIYFLLHMR